MSNESGLFNLTAADLRDVRVWREAAIVEVHETVGANGKKKKVRKRVGGSGLWHQVPAFWTAPTPAKKLTAKQLAERAQGEAAIESAETQGDTASETTGAPTGAEAPLGTMPGFAAASYPEYDVPADAVIVRVDHKTTRTGVTDVPVIIRPGENTRKMFDEMDKARSRRPVACAGRVVDSPARSAYRTPDCLGDGLAGSHRKRHD